MKVLVLGNFGYNSKKLDGQTVKTRNVYSMLLANVRGEVCFFDTDVFKQNKFLVFRMFQQICACDKLVYLPAHGNLKYLFPIISVCSMIFGFKIIYIVIGGWLIDFLKSKPLLRHLLKKVEIICAETDLMKRKLGEVYSIFNVIVLPNFRRLDKEFSTSSDFPILSCQKLNMVFMARIQINKGLDYIEDICKYFEQTKLAQRVSIDFYGQVDSIDKDFFDRFLKSYNFVHYKGALLPQQIHSTLSKYDILLLLTHYYTEGFPGSILDAYMAGIPVMVTKWKYAVEFVEDKVTGFIIPFEGGLTEAKRLLSELIIDKSKLLPMKVAAKNKSLKYTEEFVWNSISSFFN